MKNIISKILLGSIVAGTGMVYMSCANELDMKPQDWYVPETFWKTKTEFEGNQIALANQFRGFTYQVMFSAGELRSGIFTLSTIDGSGTADADVIQQVVDVSHPQFSNFGGWHGMIANYNEVLYRCENEGVEILDEDTRKGLMAMAYGQRAYCYFQMYKMYGGVPLRTVPDVLLGEYDPEKLYMARATAEETLNFIKDDVKKSIELFNESNYVFKSNKKDYYWSKAASEMLAGEVYLWSAKVATGDHAAGGTSDIQTAKGYFENVIGNYGFALQSDFYSIWTSSHNKEAIFSVCYSSEEDGVYYTSPETNFLWARTTGAAGNNYWSTMDDDGWGKISGKAYRFGRWCEEKDGKLTQRTSKVWDKANFGVMRYLYKNAFYYHFDEADSRGDAFYPQYHLTDADRGTNTLMLNNFNPHDYKLAGCFVIKFRPSIIAGSNYYQFKVDVPIYRLADAHLKLAECCNYLDDKNGLKTNIDIVRKRAYGAKYDAAVHGFIPSTFADNEVALLKEYDKEFYMEGHRWWDLRRLTLVKDGAQTDHLVFQPQGCIGYGLNPVDNAWMVENDGTAVVTSVPVLTTQEAHKLLWPIDNNTLGADPLLEQNPGY